MGRSYNTAPIRIKSLATLTEATAWRCGEGARFHGGVLLPWAPQKPT